MYSLEVDEDVFGRTLLPTQTASSLSHLVVDVVKADGGALPLLARTTVNLPQNHIPKWVMLASSIRKEGRKVPGVWRLHSAQAPSSLGSPTSSTLLLTTKHWRNILL